MNQEFIIERINEIRDLIKHENELINHRLTWMVLFETLLLNAFVCVLKECEDKFYCVSIILLGIFVSLSFFFPLRKAHNAIENLKLKNGKLQTKLNLKKSLKPTIIGHHSKCSILILSPWFALPICFTIFWIVLLIYDLTN